MSVYNLRTPMSEEQIRKLSVRDTVYISGTMITARDQAHKRALEFAKAGKKLPIGLEGLALFHCGPVMRRDGERWIAVAAGPTTSSRLEAYESKFIEHFKPRLIVGKGGMGDRTTEAMVKHGAAYGAFTGGAAVVAAKGIKEVKTVEWLDLGMPEAMWVFEVEDFGPIIIAIDSRGNNLFKDVAAHVAKNRLEILKNLGSL